MNNIFDFSNYNFINEATIDETKLGVVYELSREGRNHAEKLGISTDITLDPTEEFPNDDIEVMFVRPSSIRVLEFGQLKNNLNLTDSDFYSYTSTSRKYPYLIVKKNTKTTMLRQRERTGSSKRGDYFRETAFIIVFASRVWERLGIKLKIYSNRGLISMNYAVSSNDGSKFAVIDEDERGAFRIKYEEFIANKSLYKSTIRQSDKLIDFLGDSVNRIDCIVKNSSELLVNIMAKDYLQAEIELFKDVNIDNNEFGVHSFPKTLSLSKWNPSDIWICFTDGLQSLQNSQWYDKNIEDLDTLNDYLASSIENRNGLIGISLKQQQKGNAILRTSNMHHDDVSHRFINFRINNNIKTASVNFSYKFSKNSTVYKDGEIQIRTFDTGLTSPISIEVKGSKKSQHMSGKAGSLISSIVPSDRYRLIEEVRKEKDLEKIKVIVENYQFSSKDLRTVFYNDLNADRKTQEINSRLQSCLLIDWLMSVDITQRNRFVATIVKFAKSESIWSAPHIVLK